MLYNDNWINICKDILNFFNEIFNLKSINIDNSSIVDAIANKNYIQNVDMDYIPIDDNYSIKIDIRK